MILSSITVTSPPTETRSGRIWIPPWSHETTWVYDGFITYDMRDPQSADQLQAKLQAAEEVVCYEIPRSLASWTDTHWRPLATIERALRLGREESYTHTPLNESLNRRKIPHPPWCWLPGDPPWYRGHRDPLHEYLVRQLKAEHRGIQALDAAQREEIANRHSPRLEQSIRDLYGALETTYSVMTHEGVLVDPQKRERFRTEGPQFLAKLGASLSLNGLITPQSDDELNHWLASRGLNSTNRNPYHKQPSWDDDGLKDLARTLADSPYAATINQVRRYRKMHQLLNEGWIVGSMDGPDGRPHPIHVPFAQPTGRTTTLFPTITNLPKELRPLIVPQEGHGIFEVDYSAAEIGIAAALYNDQAAIDFYRSGSPIAALARNLFPEKLSNVPVEDVKSTNPDLYGDAKVACYGSLYGMGLATLTKRLRKSQTKAKEIAESLAAAWPEITKGLENAVKEAGNQRNYPAIQVPVCPGLTRTLPRITGSNAYKLGTIPRNTPIQGLCAAVFRRACVYAGKALSGLGGRIILPIHDSLLCSAPLDRLDEARVKVAEAMAAASRDELPNGMELFADAGLENTATTAWNKDGNLDSFDRMLADPNFRI